MKRVRYQIVAVVLLCLLFSGFAQTILADKKATSTVMSAIATAYGGPYAGLIGLFVNALSKKKGQEKEYAGTQGGYYTQQNISPGQDPYYDQGSGSKETGIQDYYAQQNAPSGQDPYYDQGYGSQGTGTQGYYAQQSAPSGQDPYYDQGYGSQGTGTQGYYAQQSAPSGQDPHYDQGYGSQGTGTQDYYAQQQSPTGQDTYQQQAYASQGTGASTYGGAAAYPVNLEVEIDVLKETNQGGRYAALLVRDGDTLTQQDNYKVQYQCNMECYVYIAQLDSTGKLDPIVPSRFVSWNNPMRSNTLYSIPTGNNWFFLDANRGVEQIYFIVSRTRRADIEDLFMKIANTNKMLVPQVPVSIQSAMVLTRGIGGMRQGGEQTVSFQNGSTGQYSSTLFSSIQADFVVTRWFHHR